MPCVATMSALTLIAALTFACGSADKQPGPTPTTEPFIDTTPQAVATATSALRHALLDEADLGPGWAEQQLGDATQADAYYCGVKVDLPDGDALTIFVHADGRAVFESIVLMPGEAAAAAVLATLRQAQDECDEYISTDGERRTEWRTESFEDITLADEAVLEVASTDSFGEAAARSYNIAFRRGSALIIVSLLGDEIDDGERAVTDIASIALAEYERAAVN
jgi:hypothetical protein